MSRTKCILKTITALSLVFLIYLNSNTLQLQICMNGSLPLERKEDIFQNVDGIGILKELRVEFLPNFKNPCWYEARRGNSESFQPSEVPFHQVQSSIKDKHENINQSGEVLRCLPYFFLIGQPKCATTDIFYRINRHPDVAKPMLKGPHWWTRKRFGMPYAAQPSPFSEYVNMFNASKIQEEKRKSSEVQDTWEYPRITGDGSTSTLWDSSQTMSYLHHLMTTLKHKNISKLLFSSRNEQSTFSDSKNSSKSFFVTYEHNTTAMNQSPAPPHGVVLPFTVADTIHLILPKSRIIAVFREPISRLYSSYLFFTKNAQLSSQHFNDCVRSSIYKWNACIKQYSDRVCAYNKTLQNSMSVRLYNGLYSVYIKDWLQVFPQEQLLVLRMEDYQKNINKTLEDIFHHLGLRLPTSEERKRINLHKVYNKNEKKVSVGKMLLSTRKILQDFYKPYNRDLANILNNSKFNWEDIYEK